MMSPIAIVGFLVVVVAIAADVYLWYENSSLPGLNAKVVPAVVLGSIGVFLTIWYSLKNETIDLRFTSTMHFHKSDLQTLDEHDKRHALYGGEQFCIPLRNYIVDCIEHDERFRTGDLEKRRREAEELYADMVLLKLVDRFFWAYADWWDVRVRSQRHGDTVTSTVFAVKPDPGSGSLPWQDFLSDSKGKDHFSLSLGSFPKQHWPEKMTVPPETKGRIITSGDSHSGSCQIL